MTSLITFGDYVNRLVGWAICTNNLVAGAIVSVVGVVVPTVRWLNLEPSL